MSRFNKNSLIIKSIILEFKLNKRGLTTEQLLLIISIVRYKNLKKNENNILLFVTRDFNELGRKKREKRKRKSDLREESKEEISKEGEGERERERMKKGESE